MSSTRMRPDDHPYHRRTARNVSRASSSPESTSRSIPVRSRTSRSTSSPLAASRIAEVAGRVTRAGVPRHAVATSKTFRSLARITGAAPSSDGPFAKRVLRREDLRSWVPKLSAMTAKERGDLPGVSLGRAPQLLAGALVAEAAMDLLGIEKLEIAPWALREGVILERLDRIDR